MISEIGNPCMPGCNIVNGGYNFSYAAGNISTQDDTHIYVCIYEKKSVKPKYKLELKKSMGTVYTLFIKDINIDDCMYCYEINDEYIVDPYAKAVTGCEIFGKKEINQLYLSPVRLAEYDWEDDKPLHIPYEDCIIYKLNVRGYTRSKTSKVHAKGTFAGIIEKAEYLKQLGITTVELMPAYEYDEVRRFAQLSDDRNSITGYGYIQSKEYVHSILNADEKVNCWGYTNAFYFAPKAAYSELAIKNAGKYIDYTTEFKDMVKILHNNGIEVVMEFFFKDVTTSYIIDCIRYWVREYHIDGVHVYCDEVSLNALATDEQLADTKIMTIKWDGNKGAYKHMASYNNDVQNTIRRYLKGDENMLRAFVGLQLNNPDNAAIINYITTNNGFTLYDLVSYDRKHNEENGENNRDGENFNYSWNCGEEGSTRRLKVRQLRLRQIKNALAMVLLAQGTPLILAGDEFANSQQGNNNPYCVDNEISWVNWKNNNDAIEISEWTRLMIHIRKSYGILHSRYRLTQSDSMSLGYPDVSLHGTNAWYADMDNYCRQVGIMYCDSYDNRQITDRLSQIRNYDINNKVSDRENKSSDKDNIVSRKLIYLAFNMHWENYSLALPKIEGEKRFTVVAKSDLSKDGVCIDSKARKVTIPPRSMAVLVGEYEERKLKPVIITESENDGQDDSKRKKRKTKA